MEPLTTHKRYEIHAAKNPWGPGVDVLVVYNDAGNIWHLNLPPTFKVEVGGIKPASFVLTDADAVALMTDLWAAGVRPINMDTGKDKP